MYFLNFPDIAAQFLFFRLKGAPSFKKLYMHLYQAKDRAAL